MSIPVFANGNIRFLDDVKKCLDEIKVEGVMSAGKDNTLYSVVHTLLSLSLSLSLDSSFLIPFYPEGILFNPGLFHGEQLTCWSAVDEYLMWVKLYPPSISIIRGHLFKLWHHV